MSVHLCFWYSLMTTPKHNSKEAASTGILKHWPASSVSLWLAKYRTKGGSYPAENVWGKNIVLGVRDPAQALVNVERAQSTTLEGRGGSAPRDIIVSVWYATSVALENNGTQDVFLLNAPLFNLCLQYPCELEKVPYHFSFYPNKDECRPPRLKWWVLEFWANQCSDY